jgi:hypothetical protein
MAVLLQSSNQLWNRTETIHSGDHIYQLRFVGGSHRGGTWDPNYFDFFRTPKQLHKKFPIETRGTSGWGGVLVGVHTTTAKLPQTSAPLASADRLG